MRQLLFKHTFNTLYGGNPEWQTLQSGDAQWTFHSNKQSRIVWPVAGVFRRLVVFLPNGTLGYASTTTVLLNGTATALAVALAASDTLGSNTAQISNAALDDIAFEIGGTQGPGFDLAECIEFEGASLTDSYYGIQGFSGVLTAGSSIVCGLFGNGIWTGFTPGQNSGFYSIASCAGNLTRIDAKALFAAPPVGSTWKFQILKNKVIQDGTGGTVNTTCTVTSAGVTAFSAFTLPVTPGDHFEMVQTRTGADSDFQYGHVTCAVTFAATTPGQFMLCGGSTNGLSNAVPTYVWPQSEDAFGATESHAVAPIGQSGLRVLGIYTELNGAPGGPGENTIYYNNVLRKSGADTIVAAKTKADETTHTTLATVDYVDGDTIDLAVYPSGSPQNRHVYWGLALQVTETATPSAGTIYATDISGGSGMDDSEAFQAFIKTKAYPPSGHINILGEIAEPILTAKATAAVLQCLIDRDFGLKVTESSVDVTPADAEWHVIRKIEGTATADAGVVQIQLGDSGPLAQTWGLDQLTVPVIDEGDR